MSDLKTGADGDLVIEGNTIPLATGKDAIAQDVSRRLIMFRGEWFRDLRLGLPYYEDILVRNPSESLIRSHYSEAIRETSGVSDVSNMTFSLDDSARHLSISFEVTTEDGEIIEFNEVLIGDSQ